MSKRLPDTCTYLMEPGLPCGRMPVQADYVEHNDLTGERHVASLCEWHDRAAARRFAMARGYDRRSRNPYLHVEASA
jgi:hypothetical protein